MRIAFIIDAWAPIIGGSQIHVWELSSRLVHNYDCHIDIFTRALVDEKEEVYENEEDFFKGRLKVIRVRPTARLGSPWGRISTCLTVTAALIKRHRQANYDLIHAHSILGGLPGKLASLVINRPLIFTVHGSPNMDRGVKNHEYYVERFIHTKIRYDKLISVGKGFARYPNVNRDIEVIPNGVDADRFDHIDTLKSGFFKIIFVGRLDWTKGIDTLIAATKILRDTHRHLCNEKKLQIHLVGYGFEEKRYKEMVANLGLGNLVKFRGKITGDELVREYKSSHLFLLPSVTEGDSIVIKEAWAARLPVLSTACGAPEYYISEGKDGFLIEKQSPEKMAETIVRILGLPQIELDKMGEEGYRKVHRDYNWDVMTKKVFAFYSLLAG